jgi:putative intracellular protease/amidase
MFIHAAMFLIATNVFADETKQPAIVRVAIFSDGGVSKNDPAQIQACLPESEGLSVKRITAKEIREGGLEGFDVIIHPGGSGSGQAKALGEEGRERVRQFVREGGGYIGVCAGAYLASAEYPWGLKLLDARVVDDEHWARGVGKVKLSVPKQGQAALNAGEEVTAIHYENGPLLGPAKRGDIPDFESLATFKTEIRENDAPEGVMKGTTAIARGEFGAGRVVCFSPHPEKTRGCEAFVTEAVRWAAKNSPK